MKVTPSFFILQILNKVGRPFYLDWPKRSKYIVVSALKILSEAFYYTYFPWSPYNRCPVLSSHCFATFLSSYALLSWRQMKCLHFRIDSPLLILVFCTFIICLAVKWYEKYFLQKHKKPHTHLFPFFNSLIFFLCTKHHIAKRSRHFIPIRRTCCLMLECLRCVGSVFRSTRRGKCFCCDLSSFRKTGILRCAWWDRFLRLIWLSGRERHHVLLNLCSCAFFLAGFFILSMFLGLGFAIGIVACRAVCGCISAAFLLCSNITALFHGCFLSLLTHKIFNIEYIKNLMIQEYKISCFDSDITAPWVQKLISCLIK